METFLYALDLYTLQYALNTMSCPRGDNMGQLESKHLILLQTYTNSTYDCSLNAQLQLIAKAA